MKKLLLLTTIVILLSGCTQKVFDFAILSTKKIDFSKAQYLERSSQRVEGIDKVYIIIFIPTGQVDVEQAIDNAINKIPNCVALLDGALYTKSFWIPYIYGESSAIIKGTPLVLSEKSNDRTPIYGTIKMSENGEVSDYREISSKRYDLLKNRILKSNNVSKGF